MTTSDGSKPLDVQVGGDHYKSMAIQPMEYSMANKLDACQHTIIKYVTRFRDKGGIQDLEKAKHCIELLIHFERQNAALSFADEAQAFIDPAGVEIANAGSFAEKLEQFVSDADDRLNTEYHRIVVEQQKALQVDMDEFLRTIPVEPASAIDDDSERMQAIGQNGNGGEHYGAPDWSKAPYNSVAYVDWAGSSAGVESAFYSDGGDRFYRLDGWTPTSQHILKLDDGRMDIDYPYFMRPAN